jgi:hypothetical protein
MTSTNYAIYFSDDLSQIQILFQIRLLKTKMRNA